MLLIVSILLTSISSYIDIIYNTIYDYAYYEQEYYVDYYSIMNCVLVFILSGIMLDLTILTFIFNLISMKKRKNQTTQMQNANVNIIET